MVTGLSDQAPLVAARGAALEHEWILDDERHLAPADHQADERREPAAAQPAGELQLSNFGQLGWHGLPTNPARENHDCPAQRSLPVLKPE